MQPCVGVGFVGVLLAHGCVCVGVGPWELAVLLVVSASKAKAREGACVSRSCQPPAGLAAPLSERVGEESGAADCPEAAPSTVRGGKRRSAATGPARAALGSAGRGCGRTAHGGAPRRRAAERFGRGWLQQWWWSGQPRVFAAALGRGVGLSNELRPHGFTTRDQ